MSTLALKQLFKTFDTTPVIQGIDMQAEHGEFVVIVGPSGCGKSTLLRIIAGLDSPTSGQILIDDEQVNEVSAAHRGCAMVFQSYALYPHMTVYANMAFGLENAGVDSNTIEQKVSQAAALLRLDGLLKRKPTQLSGGQRQRVAIGRAIVREPKIFLFDEPLSNLDAELRVSMRAELRDLHARLGATMIYVTHDQVEAMTLATKIVVLRAGEIEQQGTPQALYEKPINTFVAGFIGSPRMNFIATSQLVALPQIVSSLPQQTEQIGIRPEHLLVNSPTHEGLPFTVNQIEYMGATSLLQGKLSDGTHVEVMLSEALAVKRGDQMSLQLDIGKLHAFNAQGLRIELNNKP
jgi:multiple sugar transport system ATP-binding protein